MNPEELYDKVVAVFPDVGELIDWNKNYFFQYSKPVNGVEFVLVDDNWGHQDKTIRNQFYLETQFYDKDGLILKASIFMDKNFMQVQWIDSCR